MKQILLIEDNKMLVETLADVLEDNGYEVVIANDGNTGVSLFNTHEFDLVITDIVMPENDGFFVISQLRQKDKNKPVIVITGGGLIPAGQYKNIAKKMGVSAVLEKPFLLTEFLQKVDSILGVVEE